MTSLNKNSAPHQKRGILLDAQIIKSKLRHRSVDLHIFETIDSTNTYLKQYGAHHQNIIFCIAETQTQGKGQLNKTWHSPFGENIYCSMRCTLEKSMHALFGISLVAGLAICDAIESVSTIKNHALRIKWPNDVYLDNQKLAGILTEIKTESRGSCQIIIGMGINVNMHHALKKEIDQSWTSLFKATQQYQDRNSLCAELMDTLIDYLERFSTKGFSSFVHAWKKRDFLIHKPISLASTDKLFEGTCVGVDTEGRLLLQMADKQVAFASGEAVLLKTTTTAF